MLAQNRFETEITFSVESEDSLIRCFRERDQKKLILSSELTYPFRARSYLTWKESSGVYTYLIFKKPNWDLPRGAVLKRINTEPTGGLCSWCNSYGSSDEIGIYSVAASSSISYSYILCQGLRCIEKIEEAAELAGKNPEKSISQLYDKMGSFFEGLSQHKPGS